MRPFSVVVEGNAEIIRDKGLFESHWSKDLDTWFDDGVDTRGLVMLKVRVERVHYWDGADEGEVKL